jgi:hypothetical protein
LKSHLIKCRTAWRVLQLNANKETQIFQSNWKEKS